jgi:DNA-binding CsgD family transcriptional regulator
MPNSSSVCLDNLWLLESPFLLRQLMLSRRSVRFWSMTSVLLSLLLTLRTSARSRAALQLEVLALLAQGMPNKEIAAHLTISERTAKFHVSSIMGKLGATNRTEAVSLAAQKGLITLHS